jgi:streptogramin lyase
VGSTELAAELGDLRWRTVLDRHNSLVRKKVHQYRGREIDAAGDGFLVIFEEPTLAITCALAIAEAVHELGLEVRAGLHTGEVEISVGKARGIAVHTAARIVGYAGAGEVVVSSTLRELVAGSGASFQDHGRRPLKGIPGTWQLFAVTGIDHVARAPPLPPELAAQRRAQAAEAVRSPRPRVGLITVLIVVAATTVAVVLRLGGEEPVPAPSYLVRIDPTTNEVDRRIPLRLQWLDESDIAAGEGGLWVIRDSGGSHTLVHISPDRGRITGIPVPQSSGTRQVVVGERSVWVLSQGPAEYSSVATQINPATLRVVRTSEVGGIGIAWDPAGIATGLGSVWLATVPGRIAQLDPLHGTVVERRDAVPSASGIAAGEAAVWVIDNLSDSLVKIDPRSLDPISRVDLPGAADAVATGEGAVWILDGESGTVVSVNPRTGTLDDPIGVGEAPSDLALGFGSVWIASSGEPSVSRIDPVTREVQMIGVGGRPHAIATDLDQAVVWVAVTRARAS